MSDSVMRCVSDSGEDIVVNEMNGKTNGSTNESTVCELDNLGEYELMEIMSYFSIIERIHLSQVCLKWQTMIDKSLKSVSVLNQKTIFGQNMTKRITEFELSVIIRKCCNVRHIDMRDVLRIAYFKYNSDGNSLQSIANNCQLLQSIHFGSVSIDLDKEFIRFAKYFLQIKKIVSQNISERALNSIIGSQSIESIDISKNEIISKLEFRKLGPKITELYLMESNVTHLSVIQELCEGYGKHITKLSIDIKDGRVLSLICSHMKSLISLKISFQSFNCHLKQFSNLQSLSSLTIEATNKFFQSYHFRDLMRSLYKVNLKELMVNINSYHFTSVDDNCLQEIRCKSIEKLVIRCANSLTNAGMHSIAQMKRLKHLDLMNCRYIRDDIVIVINSCPSLRFLNLHNCNRINNTTVEAFVEKAVQSPNEKFTLDVTDTNVSEDLEIEIPTNLDLIYLYEDCNYGCDHQYEGCECCDHIYDDHHYYDEYDYLYHYTK